MVKNVTWELSRLNRVVADLTVRIAGVLHSVISAPTYYYHTIYTTITTITITIITLSPLVSNIQRATNKDNSHNDCQLSAANMVLLIFCSRRETELLEKCL